MALTGCSGEQAILAPARANTVRIVSSLPTRGSSAAQARQISEAIELAIKERGSTVDGETVEYVALEGGSEETGEWSRERELANATAATNDPSVVAYIGPYNSGAATVSLPVTNRAGLLQASPSAAWPGLTLPGWDPGEPDKYHPAEARNFLRLMPPDSVQAEAAAMWASSLGYRSILVLSDGSTYSTGMAATFIQKAGSLGLAASETVEVEPQSPGDPGARVGSEEAVFYAPSSVGAAALIAVSLQDKDTAIFATDTALDPQFLAQAGAAAERWNILSNSVPTSTLSAQFIGLFRDEYGAEPGQFAANAYDIANLVLDGLEAGVGRDRARMLTYVGKKSAEASNSSPLTFSSAGDPLHWRASCYTWLDGLFRLDRTFDESGKEIVSASPPP